MINLNNDEISQQISVHFGIESMLTKLNFNYRIFGHIVVNMGLKLFC